MEEELSFDNILGAEWLTMDGGRNLKCTSL